MTTTPTRPPEVPVRPAHRPVSRPALVVGGVLCLVLVGVVTLGPPGIVAAVRGQLMDQLQALAGPGAGIVHRAPVEAVANAVLFLPVGAVLTSLLRRRPRAVPLLSGVAVSLAIELSQALLPGRVPDPTDVVANAVGTACGVVVASAVLSVRGRLPRWRARRPRTAG